MFRHYLGVQGGRWGGFKEPFGSYFVLGVKGYRLTEAGQSARSTWLTILRRVFRDRLDFHAKRFGYFSQEAIEARKKSKPFNGLSEEDQIGILREYYAMPYDNEKDRAVLKRVRVDLYRKYGLERWDRINAIKKYGDAVKSVRNLPENRDKFPHENQGRP